MDAAVRTPFEELPQDAPERQALEEQATALREATPGGPVEPEALSGLSPKRIAGFEAEGKPVVRDKRIGMARMPVVERSYRKGDSELRLRIRDLADLKSAREEFATRLTTVGDELTGNQRGVVVDGVPVLRSFRAELGIARASAVFGERFLVEIDVRGTKDADAAMQVLKNLNMRSIARLAKSER